MRVKWFSIPLSFLLSSLLSFCSFFLLSLSAKLHQDGLSFSTSSSELS